MSEPQTDPRTPAPADDVATSGHPPTEEHAGTAEHAATAARLASSRTTAPDGLVEDVLAATGVVDGLVRRPSAIGDLVIGFSIDGVVAVRRADEQSALVREHETRTGRRMVEVRTAPARLARAIDRALTTGRLGSLPVGFAGVSDFQRAVLTTTATIPPGEVRPYSWIAREIGRPGASRAVGTALARKPVPVLIPCHRVTDGSAATRSAPMRSAPC